MYNKTKCQSCVRQVLTLDTGRELVTIIVTGQHAFQWTLTVKSIRGIQSLTLPNRLSCLAELAKVKRQYHNHGRIRLAV